MKKTTHGVKIQGRHQDRHEFVEQQIFSFKFFLVFQDHHDQEGRTCSVYFA